MNLTGINKDFANSYKNDVIETYGITPQVSTTNGISLYITIDGVKVRFSDHETGISRKSHEVQVELAGIKNTSLVYSLIARTKPSNYKSNTVTKTIINTMYGFNQLEPNAEILSKVYLRKSKKGDDLFEFTYTKKVNQFVG